MKRNTLSRLVVSAFLLAAFCLALAAPVCAAEIAGGIIEYKGEDIDFLTEEYYTADEKLATMSKLYSEYGYELYVQLKSGEVAVKDTATGQVLFTNPHDVGASGAAVSQKQELLSQILLSYKDSTGTYSMNSFADSVEHDQIQVSRIRGGVRVQYTLGETVKRKLAPHQITQSRFEELILNPITAALGEDDFQVKRLMKFYMLKDPKDPKLNARAADEMLTTYPYCETEPLYVLTSDAKDVEKTFIQNLIQTYTEYTMDDMQADHALTGYVMTDDSPPVFQLSLEYLLEEDGFSVRLPARGITFDSSLYKLLSVSILPYFGAASTADEGYTFVPDGAGAIIDFEDVKGSTTTVSGDLYGTDFSFHSATGGTMETWRMPVYGVVSDRPSNTLEGALNVTYHKQGYVAFMTEGDALARLSSYHGGSLHQYNSVYETVYPRQVDSYPLQGITVSGGTATYEVDAPRSYVGNFTTKYRFLWEEEADYIGMAKAYREYLIKSGTLKAMEEKAADIPLYITSFGDIDTTKYIVGIPVKAKTALTTFEQAETMISLLKGKVRNEADAAAVARIFESEYKGQEISVETAQARLDEYLQGRTVSDLNIQFSGWYNGGMVSAPPSKLNVEGALGGAKKAKELTDFAAENGAKIFYDLEYTFVGKTTWFDGFDFGRDAAKTVEGAMSTERVYSSATMSFGKTDREILSANALDRFFNNISKPYGEIAGGTVSTASLGGYLNSDHTEESALNREESRRLVEEFLSERSAESETMLSYGNAYTWAYADNLLNVPLDSSSRLTTTQEVPFIGIVLHGFVDFAGPSINLSGDYQYSILKTLENGASPSFTLSFDNTSDLKTSGYSSYYSIEYAIWFDDLIETYETLNTVLARVHGAPITAHAEVADRIVEVTYAAEDGDVKLLLNYNNTEAVYGDYTIGALGFVVE